MQRITKIDESLEICAIAECGVIASVLSPAVELMSSIPVAVGMNKVDTLRDCARTYVSYSKLIGGCVAWVLKLKKVNRTTILSKEMLFLELREV